jgi:hypothetical protein
VDGGLIVENHKAKTFCLHPWAIWTSAERCTLGMPSSLRPSCWRSSWRRRQNLDDPNARARPPMPSPGEKHPNRR